MSLQVTLNRDGWSNAADDRIVLTEFDPTWSSQFESEAAALRALLEPLGIAQIEHFGSTAIPAIRSKPVIDILLVHPTPSDWPQLINPIASLGYVHWATNPRKDQMFFVKGMPPFGPRRTHHLHVRTPDNAERELSFRNILRVDPRLAKQYESLKEDLAARFPTDRDAYTEGKTAFVSRVLGNLPSNFSSSRCEEA